MDLTALKPWIVFLHVVGVLGFLASHGVSMAVLFRVRREPDPNRLRVLLDLSAGSVGAMYLFLALLLLAGIGAGFIAPNWWTLPGGGLWIWVSLGLLIAILVLMYVILVPHFGRLRLALGIEDPRGAGKPNAEAAAGATAADGTAAGAAAAGAVDLEAVHRLRQSSMPLAVAGIGMVLIAVILWLMLFKPF